MTELAKLVADYHDHTLQLSELIDALEARGALPAQDYRTEITWLERLRSEGEIDPAIAGVLTERLHALQHGNEIRPPTTSDDDATVVKVPASPVVSSTEDATEVHTDGQARTSVSAPSDNDLTVVKPSSQWTRGSTGTRGDASIDQDSWRRVAEADRGEFAHVGMLLKGRFLLEREIGRGGMGVVFLARDERKVEARDRDPYLAVKVLNDDFRRHPDSLIALQREARRAQQLGHDNIVRVYDFDKDNTIVFMTMEYINGTDLRSLIRNGAHSGMSLDAAWPLIEGMAHALQRAHASRIVHSDFKPGNVMVTTDGVPKVFDFGIARAGKHFGDAAGEQTVFDAGTLGALTPAYASLEMIQGKDPSPGDDIYALGCVIFELLTGKHPFDKVSAEVAMKEGRRPPPVPGVSKRQYATLCSSVAFPADRRLNSAADLLDGLRARGLRERATPYLFYGVIAVAILGGVGSGLSSYRYHQSATSIMAGFAKGDPHHFANEDSALQALNALPQDARQRLVVDQSGVIQAFLLDRVHAYWDPAHGNTDYAGVQHVLQVRDQLKLFSPALDTARNDIQKQRNVLLNSLDTRLQQRIDASAIFADQPDSAAAIMTQIRAIDPHSDLLKNAELEFKYDDAIGQSLATGKIDEAKLRTSEATRVFPDSVKLKERQTQLAALQVANAKPAQGAMPAPAASTADAHTSLAALVIKPDLRSSAWQQSVTKALVALHGNNSTQSNATVDNFCSGIAAPVAEDNDPSHVAQNQALIAACLPYAPSSAPLLAQQARLKALQQQQAPSSPTGDAVNAEVAARIQSLRQASAANDTAKAQESLDRIRALQPSNPILVTEGPQLVANAYLGLAEETCEHGKWKDAINVLKPGMAALGNRPDLQNAQNRYQLVVNMMQARGAPLADADYQRLAAQLADAQKADADALKKLETGMAQQGKLPQGSFTALLAALKNNTAGTDTSSSTARGFSKNGVPDPCGFRSMVGTGRVCFDTFSEGVHGPALVVVPGIRGGRPYAMSRGEISANDFNRYCVNTHSCNAVSPGDAGNTPMRNITLLQANAYAVWISRSSGFTYRLPTGAEWSHAAEANSGWQRASDSDCALPTQHGLFGKLFSAHAPNPARGLQANPWGLVNMSGGVWEWVTSGTGISVRGGSFESSPQECNAESHRSDNGSRQSDVGFRLLREVK